MIITYHGAEFFKVSFGDITLAFNPISKESKLKQTRFGVDIALISLEHPDMNGLEQVTYGDKEPLMIRGPGEYEKNDVLIKGYPTTSEYGGTERINTAYLVTLEKMNLLFLGAVSTRTLPTDLKEALDKIDILFIPIGGEGVLEPDDAHAFAVAIEPSIVIPMHYGAVGGKNALEVFLKEEGLTAQEVQTTDKLTIKSRDLEGKQNEIVVFAS
jgi:Beta-lactamase superfamily domain